MLCIDTAICVDLLTEPTGESTNISSSPTAGNRTISLYFAVLTLLAKYIYTAACIIIYSKETEKRLKNKAASFIHIIIRSKEMFFGIV